MKNYVCEICGYVYDPKVGDVENGIEAGTSFDNLPEEWICPPCGMGKDVFVEEN
jgi:rubredoxin